jgi:hypothetical protein
VPVSSLVRAWPGPTGSGKERIHVRTAVVKRVLLPKGHETEGASVRASVPRHTVGIRQTSESPTFHHAR